MNSILCNQRFIWSLKLPNMCIYIYISELGPFHHVMNLPMVAQALDLSFCEHMQAGDFCYMPVFSALCKGSGFLWDSFQWEI
jgi:hypothetical protein